MKSVVINVPMGDSVEFNPSEPPPNEHGTAYTDYPFTLSTVWNIPDDAVALQFWGAGDGGAGGAGGRSGRYATLNQYFGGQGGNGGGSGFLATSAKQTGLTGSLSITIRNPEDRTSFVSHNGTKLLTVLPGGVGADGKGGNGTGSDSYNWGNNFGGANGGAGGGSGRASSVTNGSAYGNGKGGNGNGSVGSGDGDGGAYGGPDGMTGGAVSANTDQFYAFSDPESKIYLKADGGNGGAGGDAWMGREGRIGGKMGKDARGNPYVGTPYGWGGNGGEGRVGGDNGQRRPGEPGGPSVIVVRCFWE